MTLAVDASVVGNQLNIVTTIVFLCLYLASLCSESFLVLGKWPPDALFGLPDAMRLIVLCSSSSRFHGLVGAVPNYIRLLIWLYSKIVIDF